MICYHGTPMSGPNDVAARILWGRDAMVSFARPDQIEICAAVCRDVVLDNGAFSAWSSGAPITDWSDYYDWAARWLRHPSFSWAVIPDVIDGDEASNDALIESWPLGVLGVPVWHLHESLDRLARLIEQWPRVALGSSGDYAVIGTDAWWARMSDAMHAACDSDGFPRAKLHGLRMLDPTVLAHLPLASADSTNVARNIAIDSRWRGAYAPASNAVRAQIIMDRIDHHAKASRWCGTAGRQMNFELLDCANP